MMIEPNKLPKLSNLNIFVMVVYKDATLAKC